MKVQMRPGEVASASAREYWLRIRRPHRTNHQRRSQKHATDPLAGIPIPSPFDVQSFCRAVADRRGRPLHVEAVEGINGSDDELCGLWIQLEHADCIFYEASTSPLHRTHIVLHEVSHMLLGHTDSTGSGPEADLSHLFTGIDAGAVRSVLGRANFSTPQEREAEELATRIAGLAARATANDARPAELNRIDSALRYE